MQPQRRAPAPASTGRQHRTPPSVTAITAVTAVCNVTSWVAARLGPTPLRTPGAALVAIPRRQRTHRPWCGGQTRPPCRRSHCNRRGGGPPLDPGSLACARTEAVDSLDLGRVEASRPGHGVFEPVGGWGDVIGGFEREGWGGGAVRDEPLAGATVGLTLWASAASGLGGRLLRAGPSGLPA
jgi:hypothetical protein